MKARTGRRALVLIPTLLCGALGMPSRTCATEARIDFVAIINGVSDVLCQCMPPGVVSVGDTLTGYYYFDTNAVDIAPASDTGRYRHSTVPYGIVVQHSAYVWQTNPANVKFDVVVENNIPWGEAPADRYSVSSYSNNPDDFLGHYPVSEIFIVMLDSTATALSSDALPFMVEPSDWTSIPSLQVFGGGGWWIGADVISFQTQPTSIARTPRPTYLQSVYPNPFSASVHVSYSTPHSSPIKLQVFDVGGRLIRTLVSGRFVERYTDG